MIRIEEGQTVVLESLGLKYIAGKPIWIFSDHIEDGALEQLLWASNHPFIFNHASAMPDVHQGYGLPIGGVVAFINGVSPYCVGKDIGCGMYALRTSLKWEDVTDEQIIALRREIRKLVPMGGGVAHKEPQEWGEFRNFLDPKNIVGNSLPGWWNPKGWNWIRRTLGTLGGGNHFIEIQKGSDGYLWFMIHSGSRKIGDTICDYYHKLALDHNTRWRTPLPVPYMATLPTQTPLCDSYLRDMSFALAFAKENRSRMMSNVVKAAKLVLGDFKVEWSHDIHHNYAALENHLGRNVWVHRKGATSAKKGEWGIIPGSQGSFSYIVTGKGETMSFMSCPHGAGRAFGRKDACRRLNPEAEAHKMKGVIYDTPKDTVVKIDGEKVVRKDLAESVGAYKDISVVMMNAEPLAKIEIELSPWGNLKGDDDKFRKRQLKKLGKGGSRD